MGYFHALNHKRNIETSPFPQCVEAYVCVWLCVDSAGIHLSSVALPG